MDIQQLRYFHAVAATEHMTKSARQLGVAQPALTQFIHRLERELGCPLFEHAGRNIRLTPQGRYFDERIAPVLQGLEDATAGLATFDRTEEQTVRLDIRSASSLVVDALAAYRTQHPDTRFELRQYEDAPLCDIRVTCRAVTTDAPEHAAAQPSPRSATPQGAATAQRAAVPRSCTLAITADCRTPADVDDAVRSAVLSERIFVATSPDHPAATDEPCALARFADDAFICLAPGNPFRRICDASCQRAGFAPRIGCESDNPQVVQKMIALGLGVGFWPEHSWGATDRARLHLTPLAEHGFARDIVIAMTHADPKPATQAFFRFLVAFLARGLAS
jgi:DNA-binding transcriptional LysR family regulator